MSASEQLIGRLREERHKALEETNAQAVFDILVRLRESHAIHRRRWIWELLQNAADATDLSKRTNRVRISAKENKVRFSHDGAAFSSQEITRLIDHGSTKQGDPTKGGKFGSGFLAIHLISPRVRINGVLAENGTCQGFTFSLDRSGDTSRAIQQNTAAAWKDFESSFSTVSSGEEFATAFECDLGGDAWGVVDSGLTDLARAVPYVLAFVKELQEVTLERADGMTTWRRLKQKSKGVFTLTEVACIGSDGRSETVRVVAAGDFIKDVAVALLLRRRGTNWEILLDDAAPKLFYPLPLVDTHDLPFAFSIVSNGFEPMPERNGIRASAAGESAELTEKNWTLLRKVPSLFKALVGARSRKRWAGFHNLVRIGDIPKKEWLDAKRLSAELLLPAINHLRTEGAPVLVRAAGDKLLRVADAVIPIKDSNGIVFELAGELKDLRDRLPQRQLASEWAAILEGWATTLGKSIEQFDEALTIDKLAQKALTLEQAGQKTPCRTLDELGTKMISDLGTGDVSGTSVSALAWLNRLLGSVPKESLQAFVRNRIVLPNQLGQLRKQSELRLDAGIEQGVKDICEKLGEPVRSELLHGEICEPVCQLFEGIKGGPLSNDDCVEKALRRVREQPVAGSEEVYTEANAQLLCWLIDHDRVDNLEGYPVLCAAGRGELRKGKGLLTSLSLWESAAQPFADVFSEHRRLHDKYVSTLQQHHWQYLEEKALVLRSLLVRKLIEALEEQAVENLPEGTEHKLIAAATTTQIAFFGELREEMRRNKSRARRFLQFLLGYVIKADSEWKSSVEVQCSCGTPHHILPIWMFEAKTLQWIPVARGKDEKPSAENVASLLDEDFVRTIPNDETCTEFLQKFGIAVSELLRFKTPPEQRPQLERLSARIYASHDAQTLASIEIVLDNPDIRDFVLVKKQEKEKVLRNQKVGRTVEQLLRAELENGGIQVKRTGVGHDFELETDFVEDGQEQFLEVSRYLLEVKSTSVPFARMTLRQGEEAVKPENQERYVLCVVEITDGEVNEEVVREKARFVFGIGALVESKVSDARGLKDLEQELRPGGGAVEIDIVESRVKLRIGAQVWQQTGLSLQQFLERVKQGA